MKERMIVLTVHLPRVYVEFLERLVEAGIYANRCEAIRLAIRDFIVREKERLGDILGNGGEAE